MRTAASPTAIILCCLAGCDPPGALPDVAVVRRDAGSTDATASDALQTSDFPAPSIDSLSIVYPPPNHHFVESIEIVADASAGSVPTVSFIVEGEAAARCTDASRPSRCLLHLEDVPIGPLTIVVRADGVEARVPLVRDSYDPHPCVDRAAFGDPAWGQCVRGWASAGEAAGWAGVTYQNRDPSHAYVDLGPFPGVVGVVSSMGGNNSHGLDPVLSDPNAIVVTNASVAYNPRPSDWMSVVLATELVDGLGIENARAA